MTYISIRRAVVGATSGEGVLVLSEDIRTVELLQDADQGPAVPVICDTTTVVTLSSQVAHCCKWYVLGEKRMQYVRAGEDDRD